MKTLAQLAKIGLDVQDACNLSGVVHTFFGVLSDLRDLPECQGTAWLNHHPVSVLFADKIARLTGTQTLGNDDVMRAYDWAFKTIDGENV